MKTDNNTVGWWLPPAAPGMPCPDEAVAGKDESHLGMFRWNPDRNNWQLMTAQADLPNNKFTASITQLGTFALGYDGGQPEISILSPTNGSIISNTLPLINALVADTGVGINPTTVEMRLDGQVVSATYNTGTGELTRLPDVPLTEGTHTVTVSAADVVGNVGTATVTFTVQQGSKLYLPIILK
ncbi:MAG: DUF5305 domain-containing protein [Anaerolineales bacterium]|nr:DUF5305 domain-containing protein [Anaerolineales bacterium]